MREILDHYLSNVSATGVLVGVNFDGVMAYHVAGDRAQSDIQRPFYIYSISKTFTAVAIMKLCERLGCFLDDSVVEILAHYKIPADITVRQLLNHTSGLSDYFCEPEYQKAVHDHPEKPWSYEKLMEVGLRKSPLHPAGETFYYSNPGYAMLKEIIEQKSGISHYDYIKQSIIAPLQLKNTRPFIEKDMDHQLLPGVDPSMHSDFRSLYDPGWIATGSLISTVQEITEFYQALFRGKLVSPESLEQMMQLIELDFPFPKPKIAAQGLGLMSMKNDPQGANYGHGGGGPGYTTYARHYPDHNGKHITIALVVNASLPQTPFELTDQIFDSITA